MDGGTNTNKQHLIFVYGTLKEGKRLHYLMEDWGGVKVNKGHVDGYELYNLGTYPCVIPKNGVRLHGEVYTVPEKSLAVLDRLEIQYNRTKAQFVSSEDRTKDSFEVELYVWKRVEPPYGARLMPTGQY